MKNLTVRLSDLDHKRLTEQAIKKGGTVSDAMRDIVNQFFEKQSQGTNEKAEHDKTRAAVRDVDNALASTNEEIQAVKKALESFKSVLVQYVQIASGAKK